MNHTCSSLDCNHEVEYWVTRKKERWWYGVCKKHLDLLIEKEGTALDQLIVEKFRQLELKRFQEKDEDHPVNWKMFLDWEELEYHPAIKTDQEPHGDIKITIALNEHRRKRLRSYEKANS